MRAAPRRWRRRSRASRERRPRARASAPSFAPRSRRPGAAGCSAPPRSQTRLSQAPLRRSSRRSPVRLVNGTGPRWPTPQPSRVGRQERACFLRGGGRRFRLSGSPAGGEKAARVSRAVMRATLGRLAGGCRRHRGRDESRPRGLRMSSCEPRRAAADSARQKRPLPLCAICARRPSLTPHAWSGRGASEPPAQTLTLARRPAASVSTALARTLARPAKAVVRVVWVKSCVSGCRPHRATMGPSIALTVGRRATSSPPPSRRSLARVSDEVRSRLSASRVWQSAGRRLELIEYRRGGPVRLTGPPSGRCRGVSRPAEAPMP